MQTSQEPVKLYHSKGLYESYPNMSFFIDFSRFVNSYGRLSEILTHFTMTTHHIWLHRVTPVASFETFKLSPNVALNFRESHKI